MNSPEQLPTLSGTYSPEDNKLRLYASARLPREVYDRVRERGFIWAPKQQLFVAPMWTPEREDLLIELCGEVGDEDKSLAQRAEERADRFDSRSGVRAAEANAARDAAKSIAGHIPIGQPILVGHHSERRARKDAEKIENGFRKAVQLWDQSEYWQRRAEGALQHAHYKELPAVRARRIKGLEADHRKQARNLDEYTKLLEMWRVQPLDLKHALRVAGAGHLYRSFPLADYPRNPPASQYEGQMSLCTALEEGIITPEQAQNLVIPMYERTKARVNRWVKHYENRIAYERAMLSEQGGLVAEGHDLKVGGRVLIGNEWLTIMRVTKKDGKAVSVSTNARFCRVRSIEEITQYEAPTEAAAAAVTSVTKLPPMTNYPGSEHVHLTAAEWDAIPKDYRGNKKIAATETTGAHRVRHAIEVFLPQEKRAGKKSHNYYFIYITDEKRKDPPAHSAQPVAATVPPVERVIASVAKPAAPAAPPVASEFDAMRKQLAKGVQVVSAPQLFPTPPDIAARMVQMAAIRPGESVLEPEAGTAAIIREIAKAVPLCEIDVHAVEINGQLVQSLRGMYPDITVNQCDFMDYSVGEFMDKFDVILMNPPFSDAQDVKHILHAAGMLAPGGRLIAICANGPRQNAELRPHVEASGGIWEPLPNGAFSTSGTGVNTVLLTIESQD